MTTLDKLNELFCDIFDDENIILTRETSSNSIANWDSFAQISIMVACENEFGIKFDVNDISSMNTVGNIIDIIEGKSQK